MIPKDEGSKNVGVGASAAAGVWMLVRTHARVVERPRLRCMVVERVQLGAVSEGGRGRGRDETRRSHLPIR